MTAYSERRHVLEGWGFTTTAHIEAVRREDLGRLRALLAPGDPGRQ